jgi:hypothetical protein
MRVGSYIGLEQMKVERIDAEGVQGAAKQDIPPARRK